MKNQINNNYIIEIKKFTELAWPLTMSRLIYVLTPFMATFFMAKFGSNELAALALGSRIFMLVYIFIFGLFSSVSVLVSHHYGAKREEGVTVTVVQGLYLSLIGVIPFSLLLYLVTYLVSFTKINHDVLYLVILYIRLGILSLLPAQLLEVFDRFLIGIGETRLVFVLSLLQVPIEIFAMYVLVFGKLGLPELGFAGVPLAYFVAFSLEVFVTVIVLFFIKTARNYFRQKYLWRFNKNCFYEMIRVGFPIAITRSIEALALALMVLMIGHFGEDQLAAYQIVWQYFTVIIIIALSLAESIAIRVGHEAGRKDNAALKHAVKTNFVFSLALMVFFAIVFSLLSKPMIALDINVSQVKFFELIRYAKLFFIMAAIWLVVDHVRIYVTGALRGLKDTRYPMFVSAIGFFGVGVLASYLLGFIFHFDSMGIWAGMIIGIMFSAGIICVRLIKQLSKLRVIENEKSI